MGYRTEPTGKHGQFEIAGIDRKVIMAFSQRRAEIEQEATKLEHNTPAAMAAVTLRTRGDKPENVDRVTLHAEWLDRAKGLGFNAPALVAEATMRAAREAMPWRRLVEGVKGIAEQGRVLAERLGLVGLAPIKWRGIASTDRLFFELCEAEVVERGMAPNGVAFLPIMPARIRKS